MVRLLYFTIGCAALAASGCGLIPVPYVANVTGPVTGLRVVDLQDGRDIAGATASFQAGVAMDNWMSSCPPMLAATSEAKKEESPDRDLLARDESGLFPVAKLNGLGFIRPFGVPGPLGWALYNPPIAVVQVTAPGYPEAQLIYYAGQKPEPGWRETAAVWVEPAEGGEESSGPRVTRPDEVRCKFDAEGILWFYLRRDPNVPSAESVAGQPGTSG